MAREPITFQSLGTQFRPIGRDPTAGAKNQANAEIFAQIRRLASGAGTAEAERIAPELAQAQIDEAKTAAVENNEPIKMPEKRLGIIPGAQQYNRQIELGYKAEVAMSFDSNINAIAEPYLNDSSRNPAEFQKVAEGFFEGFSKSIDPVIAPSIIPQAQGKISSLFTSLNNKYLAQELKNANAAVKNTQSMLTREMTDAIVSGDNTKAKMHFRQLREGIEAYSAANPNFDKATALQGLGATKKDAEITAEANRIFNEQGSGAALQYIEQFRINKPSEWTQEQTITNLAKLQTDINRRESINKSSTAAQNAVIKNDLNTLLNMAINGDKLPPEDINELETSIALMPELERGPALEVIQNVRSIQQYTSLDAKARQDMLEAAANTVETYPLYLNLAKAEKGLQDAFKHKGIKQLVDMGIVSPEDMDEYTGFITTLFEDISAAENSGDIQATFDKFSASYKQLQEYAYQASDIAGNPVSMFLPEQVDTLVGQLESFTKLENEGQNVFPIAQKLALVAALSVDPQNSIFANLAEKGQGSMAVAGQIIANTNNFGLAQTILQGQNEINTNPELYNIEKPLISQATETWNEMTAGIYDNQPPFVTKAVRDAVMAYYVTLDDAKVTSTDNAIDKRLYKESIDAVTGGISKLNNHNYILPLDFRRGINGNDVEAYLFQVMDSDTFWNMEEVKMPNFKLPARYKEGSPQFNPMRLNENRPFADNGIPLISKAEWDNVGLVSVGTNRYKLIRAGQSGSVNNPAQIIKTTNADGRISDYIITITPDMIYTFKEQERIKQGTSDAKLSDLISREQIKSAEAGSPVELNLIDNMQLKRQNEEEWKKAQVKILKEMDD